MEIQFEPILAAITADPAVTLIATAAAFALADFLTGAGAAFRAGTFKIDSVARWVSGHLLGRVMPIAGVALLGRYISEPLYVIAGLAVASYVAETTSSLRKNLGVSAPGG